MKEQAFPSHSLPIELRIKGGDDVSMTEAVTKRFYVGERLLYLDIDIRYLLQVL